jgi:hypothetical protein
MKGAPDMDWAWMEGSRGFDVTWGLLTGALCLALAVPILWWWLREHRRSFFGAAIDPAYRLQLGYGLFCMAMAGTNIGCRAIPHDDLGIVHPAFFLITVALVAGLGPRVVWLAMHPPAQVRPAHLAR